MKKINIGIVLMVISVIVFGCYIKIDREKKEKEFEKAKIFIDEYIKMVNNYILLPKEYRNIDKDMGEVEYKEHVSKMKKELSKYIIESQQDYLLANYENTLEYQYKGKIMYIEYDIETKYIDSYKMVDNILNIGIEEKVQTKVDERQVPIMNKDTGRYIGKIKHFEGIGTFPKSVIVKKNKNGEYKIVLYATFPVVPPQLK